MIEATACPTPISEEINLCPKCGEPRTVKPNGLYTAWRCNPCRNAESSVWKKENADRLAEMRKERYKANPERFRSARRAEYRKNPQRSKDYQRKYVSENRDKVRAIQKRWRITENGKRSYIETCKRWREGNKDKKRDTARRYLKTEAVRLQHEAASHRRRARKQAVRNDLTNAQIKLLKESVKHCCYCGSDKKLTLDHVVPLMLKGAHSLSNIVMACKTCNSMKTYLTLEEWAARTGRCVFPMPLLPLIPTKSRQPPSAS